MFFWNFVAHEFTPLGEMGVKVMPNEEPVMTLLQTNLGDSAGFYFFPSGGMTPNATREQKEEAMKKAEAQMASGAAGVLVYRPKRNFNFPKRLIIQFVTDVIEALVAVWLLARTSITGFGGKVVFVLAAGFLASIATNVPYMNWYGFPKDYTVAQMTMTLIGFLLVGIVAGLMIKPRETSTA